MRIILPTLFSLGFCLSFATSDAREIPEDLLEDEHVREEFGINEFTTPSIGKLFRDLDDLGALPFEVVRRNLEGRPPPDRSKLALSLGVLIADGFLAVQCEKIDELEPVGKAILDHAKALGARDRVSRHAKSLLEGSLLSDWSGLRRELAATQADVEAEMVLLRDAEIAHLISLGGWIRALQIAATTAAHSYSPEKAQKLGRVDIADYYLVGLEGLHPILQEKAHIRKLRDGVVSVRDRLDVPQGKSFQLNEIEALKKTADDLITAITGS